MRAAFFAACGVCLSMVACRNSAPGDGTTPGGAAAGGSRTLVVETALPPGQSGFFPLAGQLRGTITGEPGDYGAHVDDQRLLYWNFDAKPGALGTKPGAMVSPIPGVEIYRDSYGVPIIYAPNVRDVWFGVGYAIAEDRLFLMDAVRRMGAGTFAELTGCGGVPGDIQQRTVTYTDAEYQTIFDGLSQDAKDAVLGYVDGANAWREKVMLDPRLLPGEYALLTTVPAVFTVKDVLAAGVFITRFVAAEGGNEFLNIQMLRQLETEYGSRAAAQDAFLDMTWLEDSKAAVSVPREEGVFSNQPESAGGRDAVFRQMADWAVTLPDTVWKGAGTGASPAPVPCSQPTGPGSIPGVGGLGAAGKVVFPKAESRSRKHTRAHRAQAARDAGASAVRALHDLRAHLRGGSMAYAIGPSRTKSGGTLMVSGPQLGYSYPLLLVEFEIHAGDYHARGSSVPILPAVGIGYTEHAAWGLTTGYSKTIDSFIETIKDDQYLHNGQWRDMDCRNETFRYRAAQQGVPVGPAVFTTSAKICRTVHGPIVARDDAKGLARSLSYAMWLREIETIEGVREWNKAKSFDEFVAATKKVTWNENVTVATRDGHIAYFHPGLFPSRPANSDMRLPSPGTGEFDFGPNLAFEKTPQTIDPAQGFVANWNNKPAFGWLDGEGLGSTSRPGGAGQRVTSILELLATRRDWTFADLRSIDKHHGTRDHKAREYLPLIAAFRASAASLTEMQKATLDLMLGWDGVAYGPDINLADEAAKDGPAATVFGEYTQALRDELFASLKDNVIDAGIPDPDPNNPNAEAGLTVFSRVAGVGSHVFDQSVMDNLVLRILNPASSGLTVRRDYTNGRTRDAVMLAALDSALSRLAAQYNGGTAMTAADLEKSRRIHPRSQICSLSGVIGPGSNVLAGTVPMVPDGTLPLTSCVTMPYQDRGSWVHRAGYE